MKQNRRVWKPALSRAHTGRGRFNASTAGRGWLLYTIVGFSAVMMAIMMSWADSIIHPNQPSLWQMASWFLPVVSGTANVQEKMFEINSWLGRWDRSLGDYSYYDPNPKRDYPWVEDLESKFTAIRDEVLKFRESGDFPYRTDEAPGQIQADANKKWKMLFLYRCGGRNAAVADMFPALDAVLNRTSYDLGDVGLSLLPPSSSLTAHSGFLRAYMRIHLPLVTPKQGEANLHLWPGITLDNGMAFEQHLAVSGWIGGQQNTFHEWKNVRNLTSTIEAYNRDGNIHDPFKPFDTKHLTHRYREGKAVVFDDTLMHAVENTSADVNDARIVVWIDIVKPYPTRLAALVGLGLMMCRTVPAYLDCVEGRPSCPANANRAMEAGNDASSSSTTTT